MRAGVRKRSFRDANTNIPPAANCLLWYNASMTLQYLDAAWKQTRYEYLSEDGVYYGEIPVGNWRHP